MQLKDPCFTPSQVTANHVAAHLSKVLDDEVKALRAYTVGMAHGIRRAFYRLDRAMQRNFDVLRDR